MTARSHTRNRRRDKRHAATRRAAWNQHRTVRADRRRTLALRRASAWPGPHPVPDHHDAPTTPQEATQVPRGGGSSPGGHGPGRPVAARGSIARESRSGAQS